MHNISHTHPTDPQLNAAEQAHAEEKRSLTALIYFISEYIFGVI